MGGRLENQLKPTRQAFKVSASVSSHGHHLAVRLNVITYGQPNLCGCGGQQSGAKSPPPFTS